MSLRLVVTNKSSDVADGIMSRLSAHLNAGERVLWLVPGGSALEVIHQVADLLEKTDCTNLTVSLTDERYGEVGHDDSNWEQLRKLHFEIKRATLHPVLEGESREETASAYASWLQEQLESCDYSLGCFGIGPDGHTAGMLPRTSALSSHAFVDAYSSVPFERITITPVAVRKLSETIAYATGEPKRRVLSQLLSQDVDLEVEPSQVLKNVPNATLFTDLKDL
jgi:6-phosphogluconolactonase/glucosamine-6-phosphate isomerase/deaminase